MAEAHTRLRAYAPTRLRAYAPEGTTSAKWFRAHDLRALYASEMLEQKRDPNMHKNPQTMRRVYDRRKTIKVTPLALPANDHEQRRAQIVGRSAASSQRSGASKWNRC
jgi:integrase